MATLSSLYSLIIVLVYSCAHASKTHTSWKAKSPFLRLRGGSIAGWEQSSNGGAAVDFPPVPSSGDQHMHDDMKEKGGERAERKGEQNERGTMSSGIVGRGMPSNWRDFQCRTKNEEAREKALGELFVSGLVREDEIDLECVRFMRTFDPVLAEDTISRFRYQIEQKRVQGNKAAYLMRMMKNTGSRRWVEGPNRGASGYGSRDGYGRRRRDDRGMQGRSWGVQKERFGQRSYGGPPPPRARSYDDYRSDGRPQRWENEERGRRWQDGGGYDGYGYDRQGQHGWKERQDDPRGGDWDDRGPGWGARNSYTQRPLENDYGGRSNGYPGNSNWHGDERRGGQGDYPRNIPPEPIRRYDLPPPGYGGQPWQHPL